MTNQSTYSFLIKADTDQAKKSIQELQASLDKLSTKNLDMSNFSAKMRVGAEAADELKLHLEKAFNVDTGKLDLGRFQQSLQTSGKTLSEYATTLSLLGPAGSDTFKQLADAIVSAEAPMRQSLGLLDKFATTLGNTFRWMLSSSLLNGVTSVFNESLSYVNELDTSLNNIRIVTGQSVEEMQKFADVAQKTSKNLSSTAKDYADAALIFYQQGLQGSAVTDRTNVVMKMANVTSQSAETVSDQMTAIWNNFYDGSKSLEYYADVITALGAATASSSDEISQGLGKFSAVADTVGLSYEYATAALATVVAETRQSADVVGTSFKTIFARLQSLKLGEALDDGTSLTKYTQALETVGVSVYDASGSLKDMDSILSELGSKWSTLDRSQQTALATTVAGMRQYNQFISLMDNWGGVMDNVAIANESAGTLQKQADTYAESWDAAKKKVKNSLQEIYSSLWDTQGMIDLTNAFSGFLGVVNNLVEALGGLPGILQLVIFLFTTFAGPTIETGINNIINTFTSGKLKMQEQADMIKNKVIPAYDQLIVMRQILSNSGDVENEGEIQLLENAKHRIEFGQQLAEITSGMSVKNQEKIKQELELLNIYRDQYDTLLQMQQTKSNDFQDVKANALDIVEDNEKKASKNVFGDDNSYQASLEEDCDYAETDDERDDILSKLAALKDVQEYARELDQEFTTVGEAWTFLVQQFGETEIEAGSIKQFQNEIAQLLPLQDKSESANKNAKNVLDALRQKYGDAAIGVTDLKSAQKFLNEQMAINAKNSTVCRSGLQALGGALNQSNDDVDEMVDNLSDAGQNLGSVGAAARTTGRTVQNEEDDMLEGAKKTAKGFQGMAATLSTVGKVASSVSMVVSGIKNLASIWKDDSLSGWDKFTQTLTSVGMLLPVITTLLDKNTLSQLKNLQSMILSVFTGKGYAKGKKDQAAADGVQTGTATANSLANLQLAASELAALWPLLLIIAAVAALAIGIKLLLDWYNKADKAAEQAAADAETAKQQFEDAKNAYEELKTTISDYEDQLSAIDKMTKGTSEWKKAIMEANASAREMIETYDLIAGTDYNFNSETGLIEFKADTLQNLEDKALKQQEDAYTDYLTAENGKITANQNKKIMDQLQEDDVSFGEATAVLAGEGAVAGAAIGAVSGAGVFSIPGAIVGAAIGAVSGVAAAAISTLAQQYENEDQAAALEALAAAYDSNGGHFDEALASLSDSQQKEIQNLGYTTERLVGICEDIKANTDQIKANRQEAIHNQYQDNEVLQNARNQTLAEAVLADQAAKAAEENENYDGEKDDDKEKVAKAMQEKYDYDSYKIDGDNIVYTKGDQTYTKSFESEREALKEAEAIDSLEGSIDDVVQKTDEFSTAADELFGNSGKMSQKDFAENKKKILELAEKKGLTEEQALDYLAANSSDYRKADKIDTIQKNAKSNGYSFDDLPDGLTEYELEAVVKLSQDAESFDEFQQKFQDTFLQASIDNAEVQKQSITALFSAGDFSQASLEAFAKGNDDFNAYLEEAHMSLSQFLAASYEEQSKLLTDFYNQEEEKELTALDTSRNTLEEKAMLLQKYNAYLNHGGEVLEADDFRRMSELGISIVPGDFYSQIAEINAALDSISDKEIKIITDWSGVENVTQSYSQLANLQKTLDEGTKKVGNSYQMTAAKFKNFAQQYPELSKNATVTSNGLIQLNAKVVTTYQKNAKKEADAAVETEKTKIKAQQGQLLAKKESLKAEINAVMKAASGNLQLEDMTAREAADVRKRLVEYYRDMGFEETKANEQALEDMGTSEKEYTEFIVRKTKEQADAVGDGAEDGSKSFQDYVKEMAQKVVDFGGMLKSLATQIKNALSGEDVNDNALSAHLYKLLNDPNYIVPTGDVYQDEINNNGGGVRDEIEVEGLVLTEGKGYEIKDKAFKGLSGAYKQLVQDLVDQLNEIDDALLSSNNQLLYLEALKNQDLSQFGSESVKSDSSGSGSSNSDKNLEEYIDQLQDLELALGHLTNAIELAQKTLERQISIAGRTKATEDLILKKQNELALLGSDNGLGNIAKDKETGNNVTKLGRQSNVWATGIAKIQSEEMKPILDWLQEQGMKVETDSYGNIKNYEYILSLLTQKKNEDKDNETAKTLDDSFETALKNVNDAATKYEEINKERIEKEYELDDLKISLLTIELNVWKEIKSQQEGYFNLLKTQDDFWKKFKDTGRFTLENTTLNQQIDLFNSKTEADERAVQDLLAEFRKRVAAGEDVSKVEEEMNAALAELESDVSDYYSILTTLTEQFKNDLGEAIAEIKTEVDKIARTATVAASYKNLLAYTKSITMNMKEYYGLVSGVNQITYDAAIAQMQSAKQLYDILQAQYEESQTLLAKASTDEERAIIQAEIDATLEQMNTAEDQMLNSAKTAMETAKTELANQLEKAAYEFEQAVSNGEGLTYSKSQWDDFIKQEEKYYDLFETKAAMQEYFAKIDQQIAKSNTEYSRGLLSNLKAEFEQRQANHTLTKYDVDYMQKKYELTQKQIALEEAQNAKNTMRLVTNASGNKQYTFTADAAAVSKAEEEYAKAQAAIYKLEQDQLKSIINDMETLKTNLVKQVKEIANDETLTIEEKNQRIAELQAEAAEKYKDLYAEYEYTLKDFNETSIGYIGEVNSNYNTKLSKMVTNTAVFSASVSTFVSNAKSAYEAFGEKINEVSTGENGINITVKGVISVFNSLNTVIDNSNSKIAKLANTLSSKLKNFTTFADALGDIKYEGQGVSDVLFEIQEAIEELTGTKIKKTNTNTNSDAESKDTRQQMSQKIANVWSEEGLESGAFLAMNSHDFRIEIANNSDLLLREGNWSAVDVEQLMLDYQSALTVINQSLWDNYRPNGEITPLNENEFKNFTKTLREDYDLDYNVLKTLFKQFFSDYVDGFDTGGYTGEWSDNTGRLAMLHSKELVLNADDTEKMLTTIQLVRQFSFDALLDKLSTGYLTSTINSNTTPQTIEQQVTIEASFPGVTAAIEIEQALNDLIANADQYASRRF